MDQKYNLYEHFFWKSLMDNLRPIILQAGEKLIREVETTGEFPRKKDPEQLLKPYHYNNQLFYHSSNLINSIDRLKDIQTYINKFPGHTFEKNRITQDKWILYHYSNYVLTTNSLYDIALILTNYVFRLGIPEKNCTNDVVKNNLWVDKAPVKRALERLEAQIQTYRNPRNLHLHRGQLPELEQLNMLDIMSLAQLESEKPLFPQRDLNRLYALATKEICKNLEDERLKITEAIWFLFDAFLPIYETFHKKLRESIGHDQKTSSRKLRYGGHIGQV
jgi:hypothetical protein